MATYVYDTFTDANGTTLADHTPDIGGSWSLNTGGPNSTIESDELVCDVFDENVTGNTTPAGSADYDVSADIIFNDASSGNCVAGVVGRASFGAGNWYLGYCDANVLEYKISVVVSSAETVLGSVPFTYVQGQTHNLKLRMQGSTLTLFIDSVSVISLTDTTWSATGNLGVWMGAISTCLHLDNFLATDISGGGPPANTNGFFRLME